MSLVNNVCFSMTMCASGCFVCVHPYNTVTPIHRHRNAYIVTKSIYRESSPYTAKQHQKLLKLNQIQVGHNKQILIGFPGTMMMHPGSVNKSYIVLNIPYLFIFIAK
jgi:hypothetical protein